VTFIGERDDIGKVADQHLMCLPMRALRQTESASAAGAGRRAASNKAVKELAPPIIKRPRMPPA
jgi:hypothetical protein